MIARVVCRPIEVGPRGTWPGYPEPQHLRKPAAGRWGVLLVGLAATLSARPLWGADRAAPAPYGELARAGARLAWQQSLELQSIVSIRSYHLVDEYLYAVGTDGKVRTIRADTGEHLWTRQVTGPETRIWPPTPYRAMGASAIAFTRADDVLFLDPATAEPPTVTERKEGKPPVVHQLARLELADGSLGPVVVSAKCAFATAPEGRLRRYDLLDGIQSWRVRANARIQLAPIYLEWQDLVVFADTSGSVGSVSGTEKKERMKQQLRGEPVGWLATDEEYVYAATTTPRLYALDARSGEITLEYVLPSRPVGGPVVTKTSIYQVTAGDVLQRIGKTGQAEGLNWQATGVKCFLAEWPHSTLLLGADGKLMFVRPETGKPQIVVDLGEPVVFDGLPNVRNDLVILTTPRGEIRCLRPRGAKPLTVADFRPPPPPVVEVAAGEKGAASQPAGEAEGARATQPSEATAKAPPGQGPAPGAAQPTEAAGTGMTLEEELIANPLRTRRTR